MFGLYFSQKGDHGVLSPVDDAVAVANGLQVTMESGMHSVYSTRWTRGLDEVYRIGERPLYHFARNLESDTSDKLLRVKSFNEPK
jgi:hypothetical protein